MFQIVARWLTLNNRQFTRNYTFPEHRTDNKFNYLYSNLQIFPKK